MISTEQTGFVIRTGLNLAVPESFDESVNAVRVGRSALASVPMHDVPRSHHADSGDFGDVFLSGTRRTREFSTFGGRQ